MIPPNTSSYNDFLLLKEQLLFLVTNYCSTWPNYSLLHITHRLKLALIVIVADVISYFLCKGNIEI